MNMWCLIQRPTKEGFERIQDYEAESLKRVGERERERENSPVGREVLTITLKLIYRQNGKLFYINKDLFIYKRLLKYTKYLYNPLNFFVQNMEITSWWAFSPAF